MAAIVRDRAAERDHLAHLVGRVLGDLAREHAAQAPADNRDLAARARMDAVKQLVHLRLARIVDADVAAHVPAMRVIAQALEQIAHRLGRPVAREKARKHQHAVAIAPRQHRKRAAQGIECAEFDQGTPLAEGPEKVWRPGGTRIGGRCGSGHEVSDLSHNMALRSAIASAITLMRLPCSSPCASPQASRPLRTHPMPKPP